MEGEERETMKGTKIKKLKNEQWREKREQKRKDRTQRMKGGE